MTGFLRRAALLAVLLGGCDGDGEEGVGPEGVREAVVPVEHALMVRSGELLDTPNFKAGDLNVFQANTARITARCPVKITECLPIHICRPSPSSLPTEFDGLAEVCVNRPDAVPDQVQAITDVYDHMGFVAALAETDDGFGYVRVWVRSIEGAGPSTVLSLEYELLPVQDGLE